MSNTPHERSAAPRVPSGDAAAATAGAGAVPGGQHQQSRGPGPGDHADGAIDRRPVAEAAAPREGATGPAPTGGAPTGTGSAGAGRAASSTGGTARGEETGTSEYAGTYDPVVDPALDTPAKRGVSGTVWAALIVGVVVLILLLVFIIQNNVATQFEFLAWSFSLPLGVAMLLSAIAGALIMALVGSVRMFTLSHRLRKLERERERIKHALQG
ncbi:DUF1049 domain-containing protein [Bacillus sp. BGMRC0062]|nr:DUF1049 domain-containing protein [Bacillus sp. BGMRC0062]